MGDKLGPGDFAGVEKANITVARVPSYVALYVFKSVGGRDTVKDTRDGLTGSHTRIGGSSPYVVPVGKPILVKGL